MFYPGSFTLACLHEHTKSELDKIIHFHSSALKRQRPGTSSVSTWNLKLEAWFQMTGRARRVKSAADQLCVPNQPCKKQQQAGSSDPDRKQGPVLGQLQGIHQIQNTAQPLHSPTHRRSTSARVESSVQRRQTTISLKPWVFSFSLLTLDYQDQHKPEEEGRLQPRHLPWRQPQPSRVPAKLSPYPSARDLPTQGQSGIRAAANICLSALYSGVRARTRASVWFPAGWLRSPWSCRRAENRGQC